MAPSSWGFAFAHMSIFRPQVWASRAEQDEALKGKTAVEEFSW